MPVSLDNSVPRERRAVVIGGVRTPFAKAFAELMRLDTIALGVAAVKGLLERYPVAPRDLDALIWGSVIVPSQAPNVGREIVLDAQLGTAVEAMTVSRACTSGLQAITLAVASIERGEADVVIAGGSDSTSNAEVKLPQKLVQAAAPLMFGKRSPGAVLGALSQIGPLSELVPRAPKVAERTTGKTMGEAAEDMARRWEIPRAAQDEFALRSHQRASSAIASGRLSPEIVPVDDGQGARLEADTLVRSDTSLERLAKLKPAFAADGTLTAGNSTALTDGGAAVLLMSEGKARALGFEPLARFRSWAYMGVDPAEELLIGPALAMPRALDRAGCQLGQIDLVDLHEAFAAQVLCVLKALESDGFARARLGHEQALGRIDPERLNVHGGSLALGHPFAATGARMVTTMARELQASGRRLALVGICAAGGLAGAAVLENASS
jgi:acetyl-CoA acyltransferase